MSELMSALDALAAEDLHSFTDGQVLVRTAFLVQLVNRASAELTRTVGARTPRRPPRTTG